MADPIFRIRRCCLRRLFALLFTSGPANLIKVSSTYAISVVVGNEAKIDRHLSWKIARTCHVHHELFPRPVFVSCGRGGGGGDRLCRSTEDNGVIKVMVGVAQKVQQLVSDARKGDGLFEL